MLYESSKQVNAINRGCWVQEQRVREAFFAADAPRARHEATVISLASATQELCLDEAWADGYKDSGDWFLAYNDVHAYEVQHPELAGRHESLVTQAKMNHVVGNIALSA